MYKYEMHLHTNACSACGVSSATEMVDAAFKNGYSGFVFTNHFYNGNTAINRKLPFKDFVKAYTDDYNIAKEYGKKQGIKVFFGIEEGYLPGKEMLIYGLKPEVLAENPDFVKATPREKVDFIHQNGGIAVCAHPFRDRDYIPDPDTEPDTSLFDAIECFNYFNRPQENEKALVFSRKHRMIFTSGGDVHNAKDFGHAGVAFKEPINSIEEFVKQIKNNNFKLIINDSFV